MLRGFVHVLRLLRAFWRLARSEGAVVVAEQLGKPLWPLALLRLGQAPSSLSDALQALGPAYVKLGQSLASRPDLIGPDLAKRLYDLQDRLPPFPLEVAKATLQKAIGPDAPSVLTTLSPAIAAASMAQVHRATWSSPEGEHDVAVKILRPDVERRMARDLSAFAFGARLAERFSAEARRLRLSSVVDTLAQSVAAELDFRLEAAAMDELRQYHAHDAALMIPALHWPLIRKEVLVTDWMEGTPVNRDTVATLTQRHPRLGEVLLTTFLKQAFFAGVFHADLHQGNVLVRDDGRLVLLDFGIVGRLGANERRFLAEILYGFIAQDYLRAAEVHFEAGYVPAVHTPEAFAQSLRAIGSPIHNREAAAISMGHLLSQMFENTYRFGMQTRPELLLLQKTMIVVEGVARLLQPSLNVWTTTEPICRQFLQEHLGPKAQVRRAWTDIHATFAAVRALPERMEATEKHLKALLSTSSEGGMRIKSGLLLLLLGLGLGATVVVVLQRGL